MQNQLIGTNSGVGLRKRCNLKNSFYPDITPNINYLSSYESKHNQFKEIYINGSNFQYLNTYFNFGPKHGLPVNFLNPNQLSASIPNDLQPGFYQLEVYVIYNRGINPHKIVSNKIIYMIT